MASSSYTGESKLKFAWFKKRFATLVSTEHPASVQATPFGLNRFVLLACYTWISFTCSAVYYNWVPLAEMFFRQEAFAHNCATYPSGDYRVDKRWQGELYICDDQDTIVANLLPLVAAIHAVFSICAGSMLDHLGQKITCVCGCIFQFTAWTILSFCSPTFNGYHAGLVILGMGCDTSFLPTLLISNLFPGNIAFILTTLGFFSSLSFYMPFFMRGLMNAGLSYQSSIFVYIGVGILPSFLIALFLMPWKNYIPVDAYLLDENNVKEMESKVSIIDENTTPDYYIKKNNMIMVPQKTNISEVILSSVSVSNEDLTPKIRNKSPFRSQLLSYPFAALALHYAICSMLLMYYLEAAATRLFLDKSGVSDFLSIVSPLSCLFCLFYGHMVDMVGVIPIILTVSASMSLSYLFVIFRTAVTGFISVIFHISFLSMLVSQISCYIECIMDSSHFGKLFGITSACGGIFGYLTTLVYSSTVNDNDGVLTPYLIGFLFLGVFDFFIMGGIGWYLRNPQNQPKNYVNVNAMASQKNIQKSKNQQNNDVENLSNKNSIIQDNNNHNFGNNTIIRKVSSGQHKEEEVMASP